MQGGGMPMMDPAYQQQQQQSQQQQSQQQPQQLQQSEPRAQPSTGQSPPRGLSGPGAAGFGALKSTDKSADATGDWSQQTGPPPARMPAPSPGQRQQMYNAQQPMGGYGGGFGPQGGYGFPAGGQPGQGAFSSTGSAGAAGPGGGQQALGAGWGGGGMPQQSWDQQQMGGQPQQQQRFGSGGEGGGGGSQPYRPPARGA